MDIIVYLLELLETQKIVGINGLGSLYKKKTPGRYDSKTHSFLPPKYEIGFTPEIKEGQELIKFISEKRSISIESANYYITEFVEKIHAQLADHQQADLLPLGELKLVNDQIELKNSEAMGFGVDFYGLPIVANPPVESVGNEPMAPPTFETENDAEIEENELNLEQQTDDQPIYDEISDINNAQPFVEDEASAEKQAIADEIGEANNIQELNEKEERIDIETLEEPILEKNETSAPTQITDPLWKPTVITRYEYDDDDDENKGRGIRKFLKTLLILVIIAAVVGIGVYFLFPNLYYSVKESFSSSQVEGSPTVIVDTNSNQKIDSVATDTTKKTLALPNIASKDTSTVTTRNKTTYYEVIGSAMKTQKKVDEVISKLAKRGINAKKMESLPGRLIKISLGTFTDYNLAKKFQDSLKIKLRNRDIYIQTIKPKN